MFHTPSGRRFFFLRYDRTGFLFFSFKNRLEVFMHSYQTGKQGAQSSIFKSRVAVLFIGYFGFAFGSGCSTTEGLQVAAISDAGQREDSADSSSREPTADSSMDASTGSSRDSSVASSKDSPVANAIANDAAALNNKDAGADAHDAGADAKDTGADAQPDASVSRPKYSCERPGQIALKDLSSFEPCSSCPNARCVPSAAVIMEGADKLGLCADGQGKCVPDKYLETGGFFLLQHCVSLQGAEGRCLSTCIPEVAVQKDRLPRDICAEDERCAPCYDPTNGQDTKSCRAGCDQGPTQPVVRFASCCQQSGMCVPSHIIESDVASQLGAEECTEPNALCVPNAYYDVKGFVPPTCNAMGGAEGRCIATCIPLVAKQADRLVKDTCSDGSLCVPCFDPISGADTGACRLSNDVGPTHAPYLFPKCCGDLAMCIPKSIVPAKQQPLLGSENCEGSDQLCVPKEFTKPDGFIPPTCASWKGAEGRCLPACLPGIAEKKEKLSQDVCADGFLCAPCFDPITGVETDACHAGSDPGPTKPPVVFDKCCGDLSVCVPKDAVAAKDRSRFDSVGCATEGFVCVPRGMAQDPKGFVPPSCVSWDNSEARCLPTCLPDVTKQAPRVARATCAEGHLCVPCVDPVNGVDSDACRTGADKPAREPVLFEKCCDGLSSCVPTEAVQSDDRPNLGVDSCKSANHLCLPDGMALDPTGFIPPTCRSWGGGEGRCLPECLPQVSLNAASLTQDVCADQNLCSPCYDPMTGAQTSACTTAGDTPPPKETAYRFPTCCNVGGRVRGTCLPSDLLNRMVGGQATGTLLQSDCQQSGFLCAPNEKIANPGYHFPVCTAEGLFSGSPGACVPSCMVSSSRAALLTQTAACQTGELCAPCNLLGSSTGACE